MGYLILSVILAIWVFVDATKRKANNRILWTIGTLLLSVFVMPVYFAKRPLKAGETREGGTGWNVLRNFALVWTALMFLTMVLGVISTGDIEPAQTDAEAAGYAIGSALGLGALGCMWFVPMVGALVLGLFLKKSSVVEKGPTGPLAETSTTLE